MVCTEFVKARSTRWRAVGIFVVLAPFVWPLTATAARACTLVWGERASVRAVMDGDTVELSNGREVRLVGLQAPKLALGRVGFAPWPMAEEAREALEALVLGREVRLLFGPAREDRHGRLLAHLDAAPREGGDVDDATWVQGALLDQGWARVYSFADNRKCIGAMLERERAARSSVRGIWAEPFYQIRDARDAAGLLEEAGSFQIVEGRVFDVAERRGRIYVNFGEDWRTDFTATAEGRAVRRLRKAYADGVWPVPLEDIAGRRVRVRGWLDRYNGPEIAVTHPEQIEVLGDEAAPADED